MDKNSPEKNQPRKKNPRVKVFCTFHPAKAASFLCSWCGQPVCGSCVIKQGRSNLCSENCQREKAAREKLMLVKPSDAGRLDITPEEYRQALEQLTQSNQRLKIRKSEPEADLDFDNTTKGGKLPVFGLSYRMAFYILFIILLLLLMTLFSLNFIESRINGKNISNPSSEKEVVPLQKYESFS
ncbi:MAG: B-box zinc finger protein [Fibrobacterota bacterium]